MKLNSTLSMATHFVIALSFATASAARISASTRERLPDKLPQKAAVKRSYIDFSKAETGVVDSPRSSELDRILQNSDRDLKSASAASSPSNSASNSAATTVRSRKIVAAPEGDSAEPISALATATPSPARPTKRSSKAKSPVIARSTPMPAPSAATTAATAAKTAAPVPMTVQKIEASVAPPVESVIPVSPPVAFEPFEEFPESAKVSQSVARPLPFNEPIADLEVVVAKKESVGISPKETRSESRLPVRVLGDGEGFFKTITPKSMVFIRGGYFNANYKKFDDRMKNGATSLGIAAARGLETSWGEFEVRAAFDIYHAMDQSVTVDNVRMFTARTEVAYWLSHSRVKPGLSLGLGMADYSIRSYRSISDSNESLVTIKTHAKSRAFTVIPATSLRVELAKELVIDAQTEFLALLGGESADAAQGLGFTVSLGWMF
ncbi:hypothetical protein BH10BDE1_BH10BDE1_05520 [soil metagenome]